jgi:hypothetical protein
MEYFGCLLRQQAEGSRLRKISVLGLKDGGPKEETGSCDAAVRLNGRPTSSFSQRQNTQSGTQTCNYLVLSFTLGRTCPPCVGAIMILIIKEWQNSCVACLVPFGRARYAQVSWLCGSGGVSRQSIGQKLGPQTLTHTASYYRAEKALN